MEASPEPSTTRRRPSRSIYITDPFGPEFVILLALIQGFFVCDGRAMALMICDGVLYAARELEFLVKTG